MADSQPPSRREWNHGLEETVLVPFEKRYIPGEGLRKPGVEGGPNPVVGEKEHRHAEVVEPSESAPDGRLVRHGMGREDREPRDPAVRHRDR